MTERKSKRKLFIQTHPATPLKRGIIGVFFWIFVRMALMNFELNYTINSPLERRFRGVLF